MNEIKSARELYDLVSDEMRHSYDPEELAPVVYLFIELFLGLSKTDVVMGKPIRLTHEEYNDLNQKLIKLKNHEPIQYIFGRAWFADKWWSVNSSVLIPRPETEELIQLITKEQRTGIKFLDIGTGSGIIAVLIKLFHSEWEVHACDVSMSALKICLENAHAHKSDIKVFPLDILHDNYPGKYDLIASNPPYIPRKESEEMHKRVVEHEPGLALFVPDHDPLLFYKAILRKASRCLNPDGKVFFEIHEDFADKILNMAAGLGFAGEVIQDINGKNRMVTFIRSAQL